MDNKTLSDNEYNWSLEIQRNFTAIPIHNLKFFNIV
jgi:hypothetical protein